MAYESNMVEQPDAPAPTQSEYDGNRITRHPDGTITVEPIDEQPEDLDPRFAGNLAATMGTADRRALAAKLIEYVKIDKDSREDWENREKRATLMMGLRDRTDAELAKVPGRHSVTHPMLMEATTQFWANAVAELFPASGFVKSRVLGKSSRERAAQAERVAEYMNYYLTAVDRGYYHDSSQMLMYLPMSGSVFRKAGKSWATGMPELRYVKALNFIANYQGRDLETMPRYAHEFTMTAEDVIRAMEGGRFADVRLRKVTSNVDNPDTTADSADARVASYHEDDKAYPVYEIHADIYLRADKQPSLVTRVGDQRRSLPYIIVVETTNQEILSIRRNWRQEDPKRIKRVWFTHHKYLPGLGFYGFGLPHVIGSLGESASGAVNALLDASYAATFQGGYKTKEARALSGDQRLEHGVWKDCDLTYEELSKGFFTPPYKEPSRALFDMLHELVEGGRRFVGTTDAAVGDASNQGPVGTTVALIEQAKKPQTAIHKGLHTSMNEEFRMLGELIHDYVPNDYAYEVSGETRQLLKSDFDARVDVISVSDPNISSNQQRVERAQAVIQLQTSAPQIYPPAKLVEAHRRLLQALHVDDVDAVGPEVVVPTYIDPLSENSQLITGKGVQAFETQDHAAHLQIHMHGLQSVASMQMDPQQQQAVLLGFSAHMREHQAILYRQQVLAAAGLPPIPVQPDGSPQEQDPQAEARITAAVVARLPPPPPPPQQDGQADPAAAESAKQDALVKAEIERKDAQANADERRKQTAFNNDQARLDHATARAEHRKDTGTTTELLRGGAKHAADLTRKAREAAATAAEKVNVHRQELDHTGDVHAAEMGQADAAHTQSLEQQAEAESAAEEAAAGEESE